MSTARSSANVMGVDRVGWSRWFSYLCFVLQFARNCAFSLKVWESYFSDKLDYATGASVFWVFVVMKAKILRLYCRLAVPSKDCTAVGLCSTIAPPKLAAGTLRYVFGLHSSRRVMIVTVLVLCEHRYFETRQRAVWTEILKSNLNIENC